MVGIDLSPSVVGNPGLLDEYLGWVQAILADCADDDATKFAVFPITGITRTDVVPPVVHTLDSNGGNPDNRRRRGREWVDNEAETAVAELVERAGAAPGETDLLSSTIVASSHFRDGVDFARLVLLTDGLNTAPPADIRSDDLTEEGIVEIITSLNEEGRLARIDGVSVEMYGIALGEVAETIQRGRLSEIQRLWERFIEASGGTLDEYERTYSGG